MEEKFCRDIAMSDEVFVRLTPSHPFVKAIIEDYDKELEEFYVLVKGAWRANQHWWVPCDEIVLELP